MYDITRSSSRPSARYGDGSSAWPGARCDGHPRPRVRGWFTMSAKNAAKKGDAGLVRSKHPAVAPPMLGRKSVLMGMLTSGFVIANAAHSSSASAGTIKPIAATQTVYVSEWAPATAYAVGQQVISPRNDVVSAKVAHSSSSAYLTDEQKWTPSYSYGRVENVTRYGAKGDGITNDTVAIQAACDAIGVCGGTVYFPPGNYLARLVRPKSNTTLTGDGATLTFWASGSALFDSILAFGDRSSVGGRTTASNLRNIRITGLAFRGNGDTLGLSENQAMVHLSGVSDACVDACTFLGMQGDGVYIGATSSAATERHNERITITGNTFDGLGNYGRQGVSIIEGQDILIEGNHFWRIASSGMPGAVDIEPNPLDATCILRHITVRGNTFRAIGGNVGDIAIVLQPATFTNGSPSGFTFEGNHHSEGGCAYYIDWVGHTPALSDTHLAISIRGNCAATTRLDSSRGVRCSDVRGVSVTGNTFSGFGGGAVLGSKTIDLAFEDNTVAECGETIWAGMEWLGAMTNLSVSRNRFTKATGHALDNLLVAGAGTSSGLQMHGNVTRGVVALMGTYGGHVTTASTNRASGNVGPTVPAAIFAGAPAVTGSRGGNAAVASLLQKLVALGIVVDTTTA